MNLLIVAATKQEIQPLLDHISFIGQPESGVYKSINIDFLITGVGMVATAYHLGKTLNKSYNFVVNLGIAGSFKKDLALGEVVNVVDDCFSELGAEDGDSFLNLIEMGLQQKEDYPFNNGWMQNKKVLNNETVVALPKVKGITVNKVHGKNESIKNIQELYNPDVESMEGGAFFYCCMKEKVPFIQIRAISNYVEKRDKSKWNIPLAIKNLNEKAIEIINSIVDKIEN
jgi:futalosine hydrolase